jgi:hypothetical protein
VGFLEVEAGEVKIDLEFPEDRALRMEGGAGAAGGKHGLQLAGHAGRDECGRGELPDTGPLLFVNEAGVAGFAASAAFIPFDDAAQGEPAGDRAAATRGRDPHEPDGLVGAQRKTVIAQEGRAEFPGAAPAEGGGIDQAEGDHVKQAGEGLHHQVAVFLERDVVEGREKQNEEHGDKGGADGVGAEPGARAGRVPVVFGGGGFAGVAQEKLVAAARGGVLPPDHRPDEETRAAENETDGNEHPVRHVEPATGLDQPESEQGDKHPDADEHAAEEQTAAGGKTRTVTAGLGGLRQADGPGGADAVGERKHGAWRQESQTRGAGGGNGRTVEGGVKRA